MSTRISLLIAVLGCTLLFAIVYVGQKYDPFGFNAEYRANIEKAQKEWCAKLANE